jgi:hypothetical protein
MNRLLIFSLIQLFFLRPLFGTTINIPEDFNSIQAGIENSINGDTVLISRGVYSEQVSISSHSITLASNYLITQDSLDILETVIDGSGNPYVITIGNSIANATIISGLTIQNGDDGILPYSCFEINNCIIRNCVDGIDYETGSGGTCENNSIYNNVDDAIDVDGFVEVTIANNVLSNNGDDGIEIRLHPYSGSNLLISILSNIIESNGEDGIQLIDYADSSDRSFQIVNNLISSNQMAGIGCTEGGNTIENYLGADLVESITISNNTIVNNTVGITGGNNIIACNNIIAFNSEYGTLGIKSNSMISYSNYWNNGIAHSNCLINEPTIIYGNPEFVGINNFHLKYNSICRGAGLEACAPSIDLDNEIRDDQPDIGAYEYLFQDDQPVPVLVDSFLASYSNNAVFLRWVSESESGNLGFVLERSTDYEGDEFVQIAHFEHDHHLTGNGSSTKNKMYEFIDRNIKINTGYTYSLKSINYSGTLISHDTISINITNEKQDDSNSFFDEQVCVRPNPFNSNTHISIIMLEDSEVSISIFDLRGSMIKYFDGGYYRKGETYTYVWDGFGQNQVIHPSGIYYILLQTKNVSGFAKLTLIN